MLGFERRGVSRIRHLVGMSGKITPYDVGRFGEEPQTAVRCWLSHCRLLARLRRNARILRQRLFRYVNRGMAANVRPKRRRSIPSACRSELLVIVMVAPFGGSLLVADLPQEVLPPLDLDFILDAPGRESINHPKDASSLLRFCHDDLRWIGRRTENAADFRQHL